MIPVDRFIVRLQRKIEILGARLRLKIRAAAVRGESTSTVDSTSLIIVNHAPSRYTRRYGDFTANICGQLGSMVNAARYRMNEGAWVDIRNIEPRVPAPLFTLELSAEELRHGCNRVTIEATSQNGERARKELEFEYDSAPIRLPYVVDWATTDLDVQDGNWERVMRGGKTYVRPRRDALGYDRILAVTGAFSGARRIELEIAYLGKENHRGWFLFGVLPLWGGRPDQKGITPRGGWNFSLANYYSKFMAVGSEFSVQFGNEPCDWVSSYRNFDLEPAQVYYVTIEAWPELDNNGRHLRYVQRLKWEKPGRPQAEWIVLSDVEGCPLASAEYSVALIAHYCCVEFGPVSVTPLPANAG